MTEFNVIIFGLTTSKTTLELVPHNYECLYLMQFVSLSLSTPFQMDTAQVCSMKYKLCSNNLVAGGHWVIDITNGHFIHASLERGLEFLSIYLPNTNVASTVVSYTKAKIIYNVILLF